MDNDGDRFDDTSSWVRGLVDGLTGAVVLATIAVLYAVVIDAWL